MWNFSIYKWINDWRIIFMTEKRFVYYEHKGADYILDTPNKSLDFIEMLGDCLEAEEIVDLLNCLNDENKQLKNKIDALEDDNETYHKSLEQLNLYTKRFIPTKCTNEFKDCKTNRYYWLDHEGNFMGCLELLNLLDCERELLESENRQLKGRLLLYEKQIKGDEE